MLLRCLTVLWLGLLLNGAIRAQDRELHLNEEVPLEELPIWSYTSYHWDESDALDLEQIKKLDSSQWTPLDRESKGFGYRKASLWLKLQVSDQRSAANDLILAVPHPVIDQIDFYQTIPEESVHYVAGDHIASKDWPIRSVYPVFPIKPWKTSEIYLRIKTSSSINTPLKISSFSEFHDTSMAQLSSQTLYFGALLGLAIYNFFVWLLSRYSIYLTYVASVLGFALFQLAISGVLSFISKQSQGWFNDVAPLIGIGLANIFSVLFLSSLFEFKSKRKRFLLISRILCTLSSICLVLSFFMSAHIATPLNLLFGTIPSLVFLLTAATYALLQKERSAKWYLIAWTAFILGSFIAILRALGAVPSNTITIYSQQIGSAVQFILLSLTLGDKIKSLQEDVQHQQEHALAAEREAREADKRALESSEQALHDQERLTALKDEFLANTSHELRTPLNGMVGMADALSRRDYLQEDDKQAAQSLLSASKRLTGLVNDILNFSALNRGTLEVKSENFDIVPYIERALEPLQQEIHAKNLLIDLPKDLEFWFVEADPHQSSLSLVAILSNAVKFTPKGRIAVKIREEQNWIELGIRDSGIGMSKDRVEALHLAFVQGDGGSARKQGGTGLGLAMAYKAMHSQKGELLVTSQEGVGTTVVLRFPKGQRPAVALKVKEALPEAQLKLASGDSMPASTTRALAADSEDPKPSSVETPRRSKLKIKLGDEVLKSASRPVLAQGTKARILVVDDEPLNRYVIRTHLAEKAYQLIEAEDGASALHAWRTQGPFDAILLDVMMPGMTGYEVCREIRKEVELSILPILILTAKQQDSDLVEGFTAGANDYIHKPISKDELHARLETHLRSSRTTVAMNRFVPQNFIHLLGHQHIADVKLGDATERKLTVLFSDIRNFTSAAESLSPSETFQWLNRCYAVLGPEIRRAGGFIDKYIGDAVMALFPGSVDEALEAALAMHRGLESLPEFKIGTGLHIGPTMIGTLGEPERFDATVLSDSVNVASRIESACKVLGARILLSHAARHALSRGHQFHWRSLGLVQLKGRSAPLEIFELLEADPMLAVKRQTLDAFEEGVKNFQEGLWAKAKLYFDEVLTLNAEDLAAKAYSETCHRYLQEGFKGDGVLILTQK